MTNFGLTADGFRVKRQSTILQEICDTLRAKFGNNIYLGADGIFAQFAGVFAEREALLWALAESVHQSQYPSGAEGLAVDNILALNSLKRLPARASVTDPTPAQYADGTTLYGLVLFGNVGARIAAGSLIRTNTSPSQDFALDAEVAVQAPVNAQQNLVLSRTPTQGTFALTLVSAGTSLSTRTLGAATAANTSTLSFATAPQSGTFALMLEGTLTAALAYDASAAQVQAAIFALGGTFKAAQVTATANGYAIVWGQGAYNPVVQANARTLVLASAPQTGSLTLSVAGSPTAPIAAPFIAADIQLALRALGYRRASVAQAGSNTYAIDLDRQTPPTLTVGSNTTGVTASIANTNQTGVALSVTDSLQSALNNLVHPATGLRPYTDALCVPSSNGFAVTFGAGTARPGEPSSAAQPIGLMVVSQSSLQAANALVNLSVTGVASGAPAQGIGSATATQTGPTPAAAGVLSVIGSPVTGWTGVTNQLDVLPGAMVEGDTDALVRRGGQLSSKANGPLPAIIDKVSLLPGVTNVAGFINASDAALQLLTFAQAPTTGSFALLFSGGQTAAIPYTANAGNVQAAINALPGYQNVAVTGTVAFGLSIDFNGAFGGQAQSLVQVVGNSTGVSIAAAYGRPPHALELVVQGGESSRIAQTIFDATSAGTATYGTPAAVTTANIAQDSAIITVASAVGIVPGLSVSGLGVQPGAKVVAISGAQLTLSSNAIASYTGTSVTFSNAVQVFDRYGNPSLVAFSRPVPLLFYVTVALTTDQYRTPGLPSSGANPASRFAPLSMGKVQQDVVDIGNATPIGGLVIGFGTNGLIGAFNEVPGVLGYQLTFGTSPGPVSNQNVQMLPTQVATFQNNLVSVSYV